MNDPALEIQRYDRGLMTPDERVAFEHTVTQSPELQKEFNKAGGALFSIYARLSAGMSSPRREIHDILLSKITEQKRNRAAILAAGTIAASATIIPSEISDASPVSRGNRTYSFPAKKVITPIIIASAVIFLLIGMNIFSSGENPNVPNASIAQDHSEGIVKASQSQHNILAEGREPSSTLLRGVRNNAAHYNKPHLQIPTKDKAEENLRFSKLRSVETSLPVITSVNPISSTQDQYVANPFDHNAITEVNNEFNAEMAWSERISLSISRMSTLKFYPGRQDMATVPSMNNWGAALKYQISPIIGIGIEGGRETFPFYREKGNDMYDEFYSITWGGASITVSDPLLTIFDCHPEARVVAGFGTAGPMGKISAGFIWQPSRTISFSPELEYTGVYIKNTGVFIEDQDVSSGGKLGFTASMAIHF